MALLAVISLSFGQAQAQELHFAPVNGQLTSPFGWRSDPMNGGSRFHGGIDIAAASGLPIHATQDGTVVYSGYYGGYGNVVVLSHGNSLYTLYGHASQRLVSPGDTISRGQVIALVGSTGRSTGPHLHFEVHYNRQYVNPINYLSYLQTNQPFIAQQPPAQQVASARKADTGVTNAVYKPSRKRGKNGKTVQLVNGTDVQNIQF
jgi:murein DD-endopeptidase MepM/ murein hydrolase activator NlpD